jgi:hypothetical protein
MVGARRRVAPGERPNTELGSAARVLLDLIEEALSSDCGEQPPRRFGRVPQDQRTAVGGERPARLFQDVQRRRVHEVHPAEIKDDRLLRAEMGFDGVTKSFTGPHVDLAAYMDDRRALNLLNLSRKVLVHAFEKLMGHQKRSNRESPDALHAAVVAAGEGPDPAAHRVAFVA